VVTLPNTKLKKKEIIYQNFLGFFTSNSWVYLTVILHYRNLNHYLMQWNLEFLDGFVNFDYNFVHSHIIPTILNTFRPLSRSFGLCNNGFLINCLRFFDGDGGAILYKKKNIRTHKKKKDNNSSYVHACFDWPIVLDFLHSLPCACLSFDLSQKILTGPPSHTEVLLPFCWPSLIQLKEEYK